MVQPAWVVFWNNTCKWRGELVSHGVNSELFQPGCLKDEQSPDFSSIKEVT